MKVLGFFNNRLFLVSALITGGLFALAFAVASLLLSEAFSGEQIRSLKIGETVFRSLAREKTKRLITGLQIAAEVPAFRSALRQDPPRLSALADIMERDLNRAVRGDVFQVSDTRGRLLAGDLEGRLLNPKKIGPKAADEIWGLCLASDVPAVLSGVLDVGGELFLTCTGPVLVDEKVIGGLRAGYALDDALAGQIREQTGLEAEFFLGAKALAGSLPKSAAADLDSLSRAGFLARKEPARLNILGQDYLAQAFPLLDPAQKEAGTLVLLRDLRDRSDLLFHLRWLLSLLGLLAILLLAIFANPAFVKDLNASVFGPRPDSGASKKRG